MTASSLAHFATHWKVSSSSFFGMLVGSNTWACCQRRFPRGLPTIVEFATRIIRKLVASCKTRMAFRISGPPLTSTPMEQPFMHDEAGRPTNICRDLSLLHERHILKECPKCNEQLGSQDGSCTREADLVKTYAWVVIQHPTVTALSMSASTFESVSTSVASVGTCVGTRAGLTVGSVANNCLYCA
jgi:hypothetical protein